MAVPFIFPAWPSSVVWKRENRWRDVETPVGQIQALLRPATFETFEARMDPIPRMWENTTRKF
ncbi:hypothetical protein AV656_08410 [Bhargavaea cecembensis]|uniref:Uncharacterized protein n=1 Tax=Bhargavaea cecembensis TaxID=394098 RepID=A0A161SM67_9BACL|nr:hypothetical protein AV656_08410 [Bhargavaea cecembensis]